VAAAARASVLAERERPDEQDLNNLIKQDHRAIKRRCASMVGFKSFANAAITITGIALTHRIRNG
jgi:transposase-like protein